MQPPFVIIRLLLVFTALFFNVDFNLYAQNSKIDSLVTALSQQPSEVLKIPILIKLSQSLTAVDPDRKYIYANQMRIIAEKYKIDSIIPVAYLDMAMTHGIKTQYDSSMYYFAKGLLLAKKYKVPNQEARAYVGIGYTFDRLDNPLDAIENYKKALKIYKFEKNQKGLNQTNINLGSLYFDMNEIEIAALYFGEALKSFQKMKDQSGIAYGNFIMGNASRLLNKDADAYNYYSKSLKIRKSLGDLNGIALANFGLGELYLKQKNYQEAEKVLNIAIANNRALANKYQETVALSTLANVFLESKQLAKAEKTALSSYENAQAIHSIGLRILALEILVRIQKETRNYKKAFEYQSEVAVFKDSLKIQKSKNNFIFTDFKRMQNDNNSLEKNNEIISGKNLKYKKALYIITSLLLVVLLLLFLYLRKVAQKNKVNEMLKLKSEEITSINKILESVNEELLVQNDISKKQNIELEHINNVKNKFFSIVSHDLRSPIATLKMLFSTYFDGQLNQEQMNLLLKKLEENIFNTADFLDNLLEWSKSQLEGMVVTPESFQIQELMDVNLKILQAQIIEKSLLIQNKIDCTSTLFADRNMINVVIRNILSNSIKFCNKGDAIILECLDKTSTVLILIKDTGIGIRPDEQQKIFKLEHAVSTGTSNEKGHHIGLVLCKDMVEQNGGKIWFESKIGTGTTFFIELPRA